MAILDLFQDRNQSPMPDPNQNMSPIEWADRQDLGSMTAANNYGQPQPQPGILDQIGGALSSAGFKSDNWANRLANGLMAAGSSDPIRTINELQKGDIEREKLRKEAVTPKVTPLADGAFSLVTYPDGRVVRMANEDVQKFLLDKAKLAGDIGLQKILAGGIVGTQGFQAKEDIKAGETANTGLQQTQALKTRYQNAMNIVAPPVLDENGQPKLDANGQVVRGTRSLTERASALPGVKGIAEFFGAKGAADNLSLQELTVDEALLKTANTKGAISNQEMDLFKSPMPKPWADPELWMSQATKRLQVLDKIEKFQQADIARGGSAASRVTGNPATVGGPAGNFTVPGLSPGASQYFNKQPQ